MLLTRRLVAVLVFVAVLAALAVATPAAATGDTATKCAAYAVLKPGNEVPPTASKTLGAAAIHINGTTLSFAVTIANPQRETFFAGHIHVGAQASTVTSSCRCSWDRTTTGSSSSRRRRSRSADARRESDLR